MLLSSHKNWSDVMYKKPVKADDDTSVLKLLIFIYYGRWKIFLTAVLSVTVLIGYFYTQPKPQFKAISPIKKINISQARFYDKFNSIYNELDSEDNKKEIETGPFIIDAETLLIEYVEILESKITIKEAIKKFNLLNREDYIDDEEFNENVALTAELIKLIEPNENEKRKFWQLEFKYNDKEKLSDALAYIHSSTTKAVQESITNQFNQYVEINKNNIKRRIATIKTKINSLVLFELDNKKMKIVSLKSQAAIARELGITSPQLESSNYKTPNNNITLIREPSINNQAYLRGYLAIEEEIRVLEESPSHELTNKIALLKLEKRALESSIYIEELNYYFDLSPANGSNTFVSAKMSSVSTIYKSQSKRLYLLILAAIFGGLIGLLHHTLYSHRLSKK